MAFRGATGNTYVSQTTLPLSVVTVGIQAGDLVLLLCTQEGGTASPTCQDTADGFALVIVYMGVFYGLFGWFANVALLANLVLMLAVLPKYRLEII